MNAPNAVSRVLAAKLAKLAQGFEFERWLTTRDAWGRAVPLAPPWTKGALRIVTSIDAPLIARVPRQQVMLLRCHLTATGGAQQGCFRWVVQAGSGAGSSVFTFDAIQLQQVSMPAEAVRVSLMADDYNGVFDLSAVTADVSVQIADGVTASSAAQYTQWFNVPLGPTVDLPIPAGATAFRLAGIPDNAGDPFTADNHYAVRQAGGTFFDRWSGADLLPLHSSEGFIPLGGTPDLMRVSPGAGGALGAFIWSLEL